VHKHFLLRPLQVGEWLSLVEHLVRDQGVGGSNPLSPTNSFQALAKWPGREGLHKRVYIDRVDCWPGVNSRQTLAAAKLTASTRSSHHVRL
jgi:hypothetical protein